MEIRSFAESILYHSGIAAKLVDPGTLRDTDPGPAREVPVSPARELSVALRGRRPPGFPTASALVDPTARGAALHFFANHELLALELMALVLLRFPDAPPAFRRGLVVTMRDEQRHLELYLARMAEHGVTLGDYGVSAFFWDALADARSPAAFAAGMSLTLEQANLDFACHFERAFATAGDAQSAAVLRIVRDDEVGHVRLGRHWFDKLTGAAGPDADATLFDRWIDALRPPLTPARARGMDFDVAGRLAAGLPPAFIERVRLARHSKGRPPVVHTFEPACELQLAHGRPGLVLPRAIAQLGRDLETLPVAWAHAEDVVLVRRAPPLELTARWADAGLAVPEFIETPLDSATLPRDHPLRDTVLGDLRPWGWSPDAVARLAPCMAQVVGSPSFFPAAQVNAPSEALLDPDRVALFRKTHWPTALAAWLESRAPDTTTVLAGRNLGLTATTRREALDAIAALHATGRHAVAKAPLGTAGRAAIRLLTSEGTPTTAQRSWLDRCLGAQGAVQIMPWLDRVADLSVQFIVAPDGSVRVLGVTRFLTDARGQYLGTVLGRPSWGLPPDVQAFWHGADDAHVSVSRTLHDLALHVGKALSKAGFAGAAGVDSLIYRDDTLQLYPLLEVNPRMTLGHVGLALQRRLVPGRSGLLLLVGARDVRASGAESFVGLLAKLDAALPLALVGRDGAMRLGCGVVPLNDPTTAEVTLALWLAAPTGAALREALEACGLSLPWAGCASVAG